MADHLTLKQEKFCQKFVELGNASEAYRQAYEASEMMDKTIWEESSRLLATPKVSARVEALQAFTLKRHEATADRVIAELARIAFLDIRKAFDEKGNLIPIHELDDDTAAAISGLEVDKKVSKVTDENGEPLVENYLHKIKLSDKKGALDSLAKTLGIYVEKHELTGKDGGPVEVKNTMEAARRIAFLLATATEEDEA